MGKNFFNRVDRDTRFLLFEHLQVETLLKYEVYKDFSREDFESVLQEALKVSRDILGPAYQDGDREGCTYDRGAVQVPGSFRQCWKVLAENGWISITSAPDAGGQGIPHAVGGAVSEFFHAANMAMMTYSGLAASNARVIRNYGTEADKELFVEKLNRGIWAGTMCLTESDAGSDVGYLRTKATPDPSAGDPRSYKIQGSKVFITCGEHDLTENIIHLVLARIEGAPKGTKGISLFIVPKIWVNPDGALGEPNDVFCSGIEHKMGIHGSATCSINFGDNGKCRGILLGEPQTGMAKMFQMVNESRMGCGVQALGLTTAAYDVARQYAAERVQGPPLASRGADRVPIIQHEDVRRMLMNLKAGTEAMRAMIGKLFFLTDVATHEPDAEKRKKADLKMQLLVPLVKAYCSDFGFVLIRDAIQILGGVGYCQEFPVEQFARDCKIISIWEGTSYIQSLDLVGRKLGMEGGAVFQDWVQGVLAFTEEHRGHPEFGQDFQLLFQAAQATGDYALKFAGYFKAGKAALVGLNSTRFLDCFAETFMGQLMLEQGLIAREKLAEVDPESAEGIFCRSKIATVKHFCRNILTNVFSRHLSFQQEDTSAVSIPEEGFI